MRLFVEDEEDEDKDEAKQHGKKTDRVCTAVEPHRKSSAPRHAKTNSHGNCVQ